MMTRAQRIDLLAIILAGSVILTIVGRELTR